MSDLILNIDRAGHRIAMDRKDGFIRVICNGAVHATFNEPASGELAALRNAVSFAEQIEKNALKYPKEKP